MSFGQGQQFIFKVIESKRVKADTVSRYLFASDFVRDKIALDAASGSGFGTFFLAQEAEEVWGIDQSDQAIDYAKKNYQRDNIKFYCGDLLNFDLPKNFFDVIVSFHTIEQTDNPKKILDIFSASLKNEGILIISTPNKKIVSPYHQQPIGKFHRFEFYKKELKNILSDKFEIKWYGQRSTSKFIANYFIRRFIRLSELLLKRDFGFFGRRESFEVKPLKFWQEPKDFIIILTKKNENK
ncbi:MAG: class I SAM-dependent methyltransferase [Patescibacteria group bacterium]|jgi:2-polyprenyl-3-methyl-5-hydroxy-6-metoxy-1,4-benzoquinol methylase